MSKGNGERISLDSRFRKKKKKNLKTKATAKKRGACKTSVGDKWELGAEDEGLNPWKKQVGKRRREKSSQKTHLKRTKGWGGEKENKRGLVLEGIHLKSGSGKRRKINWKRRKKVEART